MKVIDRFSGEFGFLSNFYPCSVPMDGIVYPSVEHAYQAAKTTNEDDRHVVLSCPTPAMAKKLRKHIVVRENWKNIKFPIMSLLVREKFKDPLLSNLLIKTGDYLLIEGNWWGDRYWGVCNGVGCNHLGKILMSVRTHIMENINERCIA